jgi:hypothetical protein
MKKTAKFVTLAVALLAGTVGTAQAADFKIGADVVSSYVWRGGEYGDSPAIQPAISYTCAKTGITVGAWGSYGIKDTAGSRYKETDLYATIPAGNFSFTVTDYYVVPAAGSTTGSKTFDFSSDGPNIIELSVAYAKDNLSLLAAINVAGNDTLSGTKHAKYGEAGYKFYDKDGFTAKGVVGVGNKDYYGDAKNGKIAVVNTGISVAKDRYTASYVYNPDTEKSSLIFMASF